MTPETSIQVIGLKDALAELKRVEPQLRKELTRSIKGDAAPLVNAARELVPIGAPLSGMRTGKFAWSAKARSGIGIKMGGRARGNEFTILSLRQNNGVGQIFDMAGKKGGSSKKGEAFIAALSARFGRPSRSMWPAAEKALPQVTEAITATIDEALGDINRRLLTK